MKNLPEQDQLPIPSGAKQDPMGFELMRVWVANQTQYFSLRGDTWDDPACWGLLLVDIARHVASSYEQDGRRDRHETLERIKAGFDAEWGA